MITWLVAYFLPALVSALLLVGAVRWLALRRQWLDRPNARSSHQLPTPSLGGVAVVLVTAVWGGWAVLQGQFWPQVLLPGALLVALLGLIDDLYPLPAGLRLAVQTIAVGLGVWLLLQWVPLADWQPLPAASWLPGPLLLIAVVLGLLWLLNLYNFMDGTDGLAGSQALLYLLGVLLLATPVSDMLGLVLVLAGALCGFLMWNWAPARIFMGDVGSGYLGYLLGMLVLVLAVEGRLGLLSSAVLLVPFWVDASYTLVVRLCTGQRLSEAHRSHAYQHLARQFGHGWVATALWGLGLIWLLPLAALSEARQDLSWLALILAVVPVLGLCLYYRAGTALTARLS